MAVSPDDCSLALRGLQTLAVRLERLEKSCLETARWLATRPEIVAVLHPALPGSPGHEICGTTSLAVPYLSLTRTAAQKQPKLVRLNVGLEATQDLHADLEQALGSMA